MPNFSNRNYGCHFHLKILLTITFFVKVSSANAYIISYDFTEISLGANTNLSISGHSISLSDSYDQYSQGTFDITSAVDDGSGGVNVNYNANIDPFDDYDSHITFSFKILSSYGDMSVAPVTVKGWGGISFDGEVQSEYPYLGACCASSIYLINDPLTTGVYFGGGYDYNPATEHGTTIESGAFDSTYTLLTNTTYSFNYHANIYAESWGDGLQDPPSHFASWSDYDAFVAQHGTSINSYASGNGNTSYNLKLLSIEQPISVPEPSGLLLMASGLIGLGNVARKAKNRKK